MTLQNFERKTEEIDRAFQRLRTETPDRLNVPIKLSWSNWGFGIEPLSVSLERLKNNGLDYVELHGNHYGPDLGYNPSDVLELLEKHEMKVSGICGMFSSENDLSSNVPRHRQAAIDYIRRELDFATEVGATYMLVVPGAVGRPDAYDETEVERSIESIQRIADDFETHSVRAAIEPIRSAEVSIVNTFADAENYIQRVDRAGVRHINGDMYHMLTEEDHIGESIIQYGSSLVNLHGADTNRGALGTGSLDIDTIIKALYVIGYNLNDCFVTFEPLGPGGAPYAALNGRPDPESLDALVSQSVQYFRQREQEVTAV